MFDLPKSPKAVIIADFFKNKGLDV